MALSGLFGLFICRVGEKTVKHNYTSDVACQNVSPTSVVTILLHIAFGGLSRRTKRLWMWRNKSSKSNLLSV